VTLLSALWTKERQKFFRSRTVKFGRWNIAAGTQMKEGIGKDCVGGAPKSPSWGSSRLSASTGRRCQCSQRRCLSRFRYELLTIHSSVYGSSSSDRLARPRSLLTEPGSQSPSAPGLLLDQPLADELRHLPSETNTSLHGKKCLKLQQTRQHLDSAREETWIWYELAHMYASRINYNNLSAFNFARVHAKLALGTHVCRDLRI
jgi:hypothetical protein